MPLITKEKCASKGLQYVGQAGPRPRHGRPSPEEAASINWRTANSLDLYIAGDSEKVTAHLMLDSRA